MFKDEVLSSFVRGSLGADISVIEGVMGLYDGVDGRSEEGSTSHLAKMLKAPVVLIIDASSSARSAGAVALGFKNYDPEVTIGGVIFNNVAGPRHLDMLRDSLRGMECLGGIPHDALAELSSRHLGLVPAAENLAMARYEKIRSLVDDNVDVDRLVSLAAPRPRSDLGGYLTGRIGRQLMPHRRGAGRGVQLLLRGEHGAACRPGVEIVPFSPIRDPLPEVDGLYFGGGYPEVFAPQLESASAMRKEGRRAASAGRPIYAECGGMMYFCDSVTDGDGRKRRMCGVFDAEVEMTDRLQALGYVEVKARKENVLSKAGWTTRD
jgi:cobyrinic acid a,c-diamide synthase